MADDREPGTLNVSLLRALRYLIAWGEPFDYEDDDDLPRFV
ncbi:MAG: hypothetical protein ACYDH6_13320 [Acidimicrobiales bacterium]